MTQEEKKLLIKDICGRLQYRVKLGFENSDLILVPKEFNIYTMQLSTGQIYPESDSMVIGHVYDIWNYRPYLRLMNSMTEEEKKVVCSMNMISDTELNDRLNHQRMYVQNYTIETFDYFNERHLDYRGLIPMGLALEAKEGMYKI